MCCCQVTCFPPAGTRSPLQTYSFFQCLIGNMCCKSTPPSFVFDFLFVYMVVFVGTRKKVFFFALSPCLMHYQFPPPPSLSFLLAFHLLRPTNKISCRKQFFFIKRLRLSTCMPAARGTALPLHYYLDNCYHYHYH